MSTWNLMDLVAAAAAEKGGRFAQGAAYYAGGDATAEQCRAAAGLHGVDAETRATLLAWAASMEIDEQRAAWRAYQKQRAADLRGKGVFADLLAPLPAEAQAHLDRAGDYARGWQAADDELVGAADSLTDAGEAVILFLVELARAAEGT